MPPRPAGLPLHRLALGCVAAALALAGCEREPELPPGVKLSQERANTAKAAMARRGPAQDEKGVTPLGERIATLGLLNKRNNLTRDLRLRPGEAQRIDNVIVKLAACERTAPWEFPRQTGAFAQVFVRAAGSDGDWGKVFSGWLFRETPSLNVVEHPIYDVWVKDCRMSFEGDRPAPSASESSAPNASGSGSAPRPAPPRSPTPTPTPTPAPSPEASPSNVT